MTEPDIDSKLDQGDLSGAVNLGIERYGSELVGFLAVVHGNREEGAEVFAQACEDLVRAMPLFRRDCSFRTWIYSIAKNASRRHIDQVIRHRNLGLSEAVEIPLAARRVTDAFLKTEWKDRLRALRQSLDPDERALLVLRVDRQMAWNEIARVLGGSPEDSTPPSAREVAALRKRFERIKATLRSKAIESGWWNVD